MAPFYLSNRNVNHYYAIIILATPACLSRQLLLKFQLYFVPFHKRHQSRAEAELLLTFVQVHRIGKCSL